MKRLIIIMVAVALNLMLTSVSCYHTCVEPGYYREMNLYKMDVDYSDYVPVEMSDDFKTIVSTPYSYGGDTISRPHKFVNGYFSGANYGIYTAYIDLLIKDYNHDAVNVEQHKLFLNPYSEYYVIKDHKSDNKLRLPDGSLNEELINQIISEGKIKDYFKLVYYK